MPTNSANAKLQYNSPWIKKRDLTYRALSDKFHEDPYHSRSFSKLILLSSLFGRSSKSVIENPYLVR